MKKLANIVIFCVFAVIYVVCLFNLDDVVILAGNITPVVNLAVLSVLVCIGLVIGPYATSISYFLQSRQGVKRYHFYIVFTTVALFKILAFYITPGLTQYMWIWPDGAGFVYDMQKILQDPASIFSGAMKSPFYSTWIAINHVLFSKIIGPLGTGTYFGYPVNLNDIAAPIFLQNIIGIISALICFAICARINTGFAYIVTLLSFFNPTALAVDNTVLRESFALFFVLGAFLMFIKSVEQKKYLYAITSGILFVLAYQVRPELIILYAIICFAFFVNSIFILKRVWKILILSCIPVVISIFFSGNLSSEYAKNTNKGRFGIAMHGLKTKCFFYDSPTFPEFIESMQGRLKQLEKERMAPCEAPASTWQLVWFATDEEKARYNKLVEDKKTRTQIKIESDDQIFLDILKYNTSAYIQSWLINVGYNLIHNVENMSPILYDGDNYWIAQNWVYYTSPKMLVLYEKNKPYHRYIIAIFRVIELYTTRKILLPFFFIGSIVIFKLIRTNFFSHDNIKIFLLTCVLLISWVHLFIISALTYTAARFIYVLVPFIFTVEIAGVVGVFYWLKSWLFNSLRPN